MGCGQSNGGAFVVAPGQKPVQRAEAAAVTGACEGWEAPLSVQATPRSPNSAHETPKKLQGVDETLRTESLQNLQGAVATFLLDSGLQGLQTANTQTGLATDLDAPGKSADRKSEEALVLLKEAIAIYEGAQSEEMQHSDMNLAATHDIIGSFLFNQGKYPDAVEEFKRCLSIGEKALGKEHPRLSAAHNHLGTVYFKQGKIEAALWHNRQSLAIEVAALGGTHPDVATTHSNIGSVFFNNGRYEDAVAEFEACLAIRREALGEGHVDVAETHNNIGAVRFYQGKYSEAQEQHERCLAIKLKALGESHPSLAATYANIGTLLDTQGKHEEALHQLEKCLAIQKSSTEEEEDPRAVGHTKFVMARLQLKRGDLGNAGELFRDCAGIYGRAYGEGHRQTLAAVTEARRCLEWRQDV